MNKKYYDIYLILKKLGFKSSNYGTKLLTKVILEASKSEDEIHLKDIYSTISKTNNIPPNDIQRLIFYAINSRNKNLSKKNFKDIFGYEYDEGLFVCKELVEYLAEIIDEEKYGV